MEIAILVTVIVGFIITWIACSKPATESDLETKPGMMMINPYDFEKESLKSENYTLRKKLYDLERELEYRKYRGWDLDALRKILERPVEVNVDVNVQN